MNAEELMEAVYERLDYSLDLEGRKKVIEKIEDELGCAFNKVYTTYFIEGRKSYDTNKIIMDFNKMCDTMSDYILFADNPNETEEQKESLKEYPVAQEKDLKDGKADTFLDFDFFANSLIALEFESDRLFSTNTKRQNTTVEYVLKNMRDCPYIHHYMRFDKHVRVIIENLDKQVQKRVARGENPDNITDLKWKNPNTGKVFYYTFQQLNAIKRGVGYRKNNCIELNRDVIAVYNSYYQPIGGKTTSQTYELAQRIEMDFKDTSSVRGLVLNSSMSGWSGRLDRLLRRLDALVSVAGLTSSEYEVYKILRRGKESPQDDNQMFAQRYTQREVAQILGIAYQGVSETVDRIVKKIIKAAEIQEIEDFYTFEEKGSYKKCARCGQNKLQLPHNFYYRKSTGRYDSYCKSCR